MGASVRSTRVHVFALGVFPNATISERGPYKTTHRILSGNAWKERSEIFDSEERAEKSTIQYETRPLQSQVQVQSLLLSETPCFPSHLIGKREEMRSQPSSSDWLNTLELSRERLNSAGGTSDR